MSKNKPSETEALELIALRKVISAKLVWKPSNSGWRLEAKASAIERDEIFEIRGVLGKSNYSFALLYNLCPIRKYTKHWVHIIGGIRYEQPHKHVWNGETENCKAYVPDDIIPSADINDQFLDFCKECNIEIVGDYQRVMNFGCKRE